MDSSILYLIGMILFIFWLGGSEVIKVFLILIPVALISYLTFQLELFNPFIGASLAIFIYSFLGPTILMTYKDGDFTFTKAFKDSFKFFGGWLAYIVAMAVIALILVIALSSSGPYYDL